MNKKITVALAQMKSIVGNPEANVQKATQVIAEASRQGADIVCFPELFISGYNMINKALYTRDSIEDSYAYAIGPLQKSAAENKIHLLIPMAYMDGSKKINGALLINDAGEIIGKYGKTHLFAQERINFDKGGHLETYETTFGTIGIMICYDAGFPEVSRVLALKGAQVIFCPSAWKVEDKRVWDLNMSQRALENCVYVVAVNAVGNNSGLHLFGNSKVVDPKGECLLEGAMDSEELFIETLDLDHIQTFKNYLNYMEDRNPSLYTKISSTN